MFSGIVQGIGNVVSIGAGRLSVTAPPWPEPFQSGESIAVNGVCLTLTKMENGRLCFDILKETAKRTNFGALKRGQRVNLERSLRAGDAIGGHFVTGHVDGTGIVRKLDQARRDWILDIKCSRTLANGIVEKGSIAVDGVSLTVVDARSDGFTTHLIPHTWKHTSLSGLEIGSAVNLETDMMGKYVRRHLHK